MIALAASVLLAAYLLIPSSLFRLAFGRFVPLRNFIRTRAEEILYSILATIIPLGLAWGLVWTVPLCQSQPFHISDSPQLRRSDSRVVLTALYSEDKFKSYGDDFWKAFTRASRRQGRLLSWYYILAVAEGLVSGILASLYGRLRKYRLYRGLADRILLPSISEWYVLLTPFLSTDKRTIVRADILCNDGTLYRGRVYEHFLDKEGQLSGLILTEARRFARNWYVRDTEKGVAKNKADYWRDIPGAKLYVCGDKILNLNLSYEPSPEVMAGVISRQLKQPVTVVIESRRIHSDNQHVESNEGGVL